MARPKGITIKQIEEAIKKTGGFLYEVAEMLGCAPQNIFQRVARSEYLQNVMKDYEKTYVNLAESNVIEGLREKNPTYTMFYLKCKGGYSERQIIDANVKLTQDDWVKKMEQIEADKAGRTKTKAKK